MFKPSDMRIMRDNDARLAAEAARLVADARRMLLWSRSVVGMEAPWVDMDGVPACGADGPLSPELVSADVERASVKRNR